MKYNVLDFKKESKIGIIGDSISYEGISECYKEFKACYLIGLNNNMVNYIKPYSRKKQFVGICNHKLHPSYEKADDYLNIKDIQIPLTLDYIQSYKPWLEDQIAEYEERNPEHDIFLLDDDFKAYRNKTQHFLYTTQKNMTLAIACSCQPEEIYIMGQDFYPAANWFASKHKENDNIKAYVKTVVTDFEQICKDNPNIKFHIYTNYPNLPSLDNLNVTILEKDF